MLEITERKLSEMFDDEVLPSILEIYGPDDQPAIDEGFNNWTDSLCKDGAISEHAAYTFIYVGKYATD